LGEQVEQRLEKSAEEGRTDAREDIVHTLELKDGHVKTQDEMLRQSQEGEHAQNVACEPGGSGASSGGGGGSQSPQDTLPSDPNYQDAISFWEPKPPKVFMKDPNAKPLELRGQIQLYATNE
jgi:hypothetical protein